MILKLYLDIHTDYRCLAKIINLYVLTTQYCIVYKCIVCTGIKGTVLKEEI